MPPKVGDPAPLFSGPILGTTETFSLQDHHGEIVVLIFSGVTWCDPCKFEAPFLQSLWEEFQATCYVPTIRFVLVHGILGSLNWDVELAKLPSAVALFGITFPVVVEESVWQLYEVYAAPQIFVVGPDQKICAHKRGGLPEKGYTTSGGFADQYRSFILSCGAGECWRDARWFGASQILFGVTQDQGGFGIAGGKPRPVPPWDPLRRDALLALAISELVAEVSDADTRRTIERGALDALGTAITRMRQRFDREAMVLEAVARDNALVSASAGRAQIGRTSTGRAQSGRASAGRTRRR